MSLGDSDAMRGGGLLGGEDDRLWWGAVGLVGYKVQWVAAVVEWPAHRRWDFFSFFIICYTGNQAYTSTLPLRNTPSLESFKFVNFILLIFVTYDLNIMLKKTYLRLMMRSLLSVYF